MGWAQQAIETLGVLEAGGYAAPSGRWVDLRVAIDAAVAGTRLYDPEQVARLAAAQPMANHRMIVEVTEEDTIEAGRRLAEAGGRVAALNFASARNPGGGFLGGARAQEEDLCRASALYRCLSARPEYYTANRAERSALYTDHLILSPDVPFFRDGRGVLLEKPFSLTVLTSPAPNTGAVLQLDPDAGPVVAATFRRRAAQILAVARAERHDELVLGAWGCGAFQGDPEAVATAFADALGGSFARTFRRVLFAVRVRSRRDARNLEVFRRRLSQLRGG